MKMTDGVKRNNDPWAPLPEDSLSIEQRTALGLSLEDPLRQMLDSDRYIKSLESKLKKLTKSKTTAEPSSKDIISSLALFHNDQMKRYVDSAILETSDPSNISSSEDSVNPLAYMQRKLHPEKQPLSAEELLELLKEDILAKIFEESSDRPSTSTESSNRQKELQTVLPLPNPQDSIGLSEDSKPSVSHQPNPQNDSSVNSSSENWANFDDMNAQLSNSEADDS